MPETTTRRPHQTGHVTGSLGMSPYGLGRYNITIDPMRSRDEIWLKIDERFGPQIADHRDHSLRMSRRAAEELRNALNEALDWKPEDDS